jgi:hypothetical protein
MANAKRGTELKPVWVIEDAFIVEPYVGGMLLGELSKFDLTGYKTVRRLSQKEIDKKFSDYYRKYGYWPETSDLDV